MRLLLDASVFQLPPTGVAKAAYYLYEACLRDRPELTVTAIHRKPLRVPVDNVMRPLKLLRFAPDQFWRGAILPTATRLFRPDAVHFPWNGRIPVSMPGVPIVMTLHDVLPLSIPGWTPSGDNERDYKPRLQADLSRADLVITDSEYSKREILRHFSVSREPVVVPLGFTLGSENLNPSAIRHDDYFLYVGGYNSRKGIDKLVATYMSLWKAGNVKSKLVLTGVKKSLSPEFDRMTGEARNAGILEELGYCTDSMLASLYAGAKALVYPSKFEGFGLPPLEAMTLGCPVLTTQETSIPEVCGDAALYADPDNPNEFGSAIRTLEDKSAVRENLRRKGLARAALFSWQNAATKYLAALDDTIRRSGRH